MPDEQKDISIIIVNWNTKDILRNCLESIFRTVATVTFEVIVVDNGSTDGSTDMVAGEFPGVRLIANKENLGFGVANNQALRTMHGRYALLLNSDTVLTERAVYELFSFMEAHDDAAMACGQLLNEDGSKQHSFANFPSLLTLSVNAPLLEFLFPRLYPSKRYNHEKAIEVDSCIGACMMVRKKSMDKVGFFDERYFFFFEETDWAFAMRKAGWKIYHVPSARIYHLQGKSIGANVRSRIEFYRSRYQYFKKWYAPPYYAAIRTVILLRLAINWLLTSVGVLLCCGSQKSLRDKWLVYSHLLLWHASCR